MLFRFCKSLELGSFYVVLDATNLRYSEKAFAQFTPKIIPDKMNTYTKYWILWLTSIGNEIK